MDGLCPRPRDTELRADLAEGQAALAQRQCLASTLVLLQTAFGGHAPIPVDPSGFAIGVESPPAEVSVERRHAHASYSRRLLRVQAGTEQLDGPVDLGAR